MSYWTSEEFRTRCRPGVKLTATEDGIVARWGSLSRVLTPTQARMLADQLKLAADESEKRGAQDWLE